MNDEILINKFSNLHVVSHYYPWIDFHMNTPIINRFYNKISKIEEIKNCKVQLVINNRCILPFNPKYQGIPGNIIAKKTIYQFITGLYELSKN